MAIICFGENIQFNINGVLYNRETDVGGIAKLNINLVQGKYIITTMFGDSVVSNTIPING